MMNVNRRQALQAAACTAISASLPAIAEPTLASSFTLVHQIDGKNVPLFVFRSFDSGLSQISFRGGAWHDIPRDEFHDFRQKGDGFDAWIRFNWKSDDDLKIDIVSVSDYINRLPQETRA